MDEWRYGWFGELEHFNSFFFFIFAFYTSFSPCPSQEPLLKYDLNF